MHTLQTKLLTYFIAAIWFVNGLFCKVLNLVPRHQDIVERILGNEHARVLTLLIGLSEIMMAIWIISEKYSRTNSIIQMIVVALMNILEYILAPDLLLWGRLNIVFAFIFILLIMYNEFFLKKKQLTIK